MEPSWLSDVKPQGTSAPRAPRPQTPTGGQSAAQENQEDRAEPEVGGRTLPRGVRPGARGRLQPWPGAPRWPRTEQEPATAGTGRAFNSGCSLEHLKIRNKETTQDGAQGAPWISVFPSVFGRLQRSSGHAWRDCSNWFRPGAACLNAGVGASSAGLRKVLRRTGSLWTPGKDTADVSASSAQAPTVHLGAGHVARSRLSHQRDDHG